MAEGGQIIPGEELSRFMECAVCLNPMTDHKALPCQHSFCQSCLEPLVNDGSIPCPICREVCPLKDSGIAGLPRNPLLASIMDQSCQRCQLRNKDILCSHCGMDLCKTCHKLCVDNVNKVKTQLQTSTEEVVCMGRRVLHQIHQDSVRVHNQMTKACEQIDETTQTLIESILARHRKLKQELLKEGNAEMDRLDAQYQELSNRIENLKAFSDVSHTTIQNLGRVHGLCKKWQAEINHTEKSSKITNKNNIEFTGDVQRIVYSNSKYGKVQNTVSTRDQAELPKNTTFQVFDEVATRDDQALGTNPICSPTLANMKSQKKPQIVGCKGKQDGQFMSPTHVALSPVTGNIVVCDTSNHRVQVLSSQGEFLHAFGSQGQAGGQFDFGRLCNVGGITVTTKGVIVVADSNNHRLQMFTEQGQLIYIIGRKGTDPGEFQSPRGLACDSNGRIYVCDCGNKRIQVLEQDGAVVNVFGTEDVMGDWAPSDIDLLSDGEVIVADWKGKIEVFTANGQHKSIIKHHKLKKLSGIAVDKQDNIFVGDYEGHNVHVFRPSGEFIFHWGRRGGGPGEFNKPVGIACSLNDQVLVVDQGNHRLQCL